MEMIDSNTFFWKLVDTLSINIHIYQTKQNKTTQKIQENLENPNISGLQFEVVY